ncbi:uncharacterized protein LOC126410286 [Nymphaea colorata]|uniref:uncharacterized protein LOC126410286 n=1 Tax=Nymphaea colorata TaxID=210225 RepID=UPI00214ECF57|nr:uncharacterized protein LOC126410286 [Nymphaea colorata]
MMRLDDTSAMQLSKHPKATHAIFQIQDVYEGGGAEKGIGGIWNCGTPGIWGIEGIWGIVGIEGFLGTDGIEGMVGIEGIIGGMEGRDDGKVGMVGMLGMEKGKEKGRLGRPGMAEPPPVVGVLCSKWRAATTTSVLKRHKETKMVKERRAL